MAQHEDRRTPFSLRRALLLGLLLVLAGAGFGGVLASSASASHALDPPSALTVSPGPAGTVDTPTWSYVVAAGDTASCTLTDASSTVVESHDPCPQPFTAQPLPGDGAYTFAVRSVRAQVTDPVDGSTVEEGGTSAAAESSYLLDRAAPELTLAPPATGTPYAETTGWTLGVSPGGSTFTPTCTVALDAGAPSGFTCNPDDVKPALTANGTYTVTVSGTDAAGNPAEAVSADYVHDGVPPQVTIVAAPTGPSTSATPLWEYTVLEGSAPTCTLTGPDVATAVVDCGPTSYTGALTTSGSYTLTVRSTDAAGNVGSATSVPYVYDVSGPQVTITPGGATTGTAADVSWTVDVGDATSASCSVDEAAPAACATGSVLTATLPADGTATLTVTARDALGNESTGTASYTRETTPAAPTVTVDPTLGTTPSATWEFTVDGLTGSVQCRLDGPGGAGAVGLCTSFDGSSGSHTAELEGDGVYTLHVIASSSTGGAGPSGQASYTLDRSEPAGPVVTQSPAASTGSAPTVSWTWEVGAGTTQCRIGVNGVFGDWTACNGTASTPTSAQGTYTVQVKFVDVLLNEGTPSSASYVFDSVAPGLPSATLEGATTRPAGSVTWTIATTEDGVSTECRVIGPGVDESTVGWGACTMPVELTAHGVHELQVRQYDAAGNVSAVLSRTVTIDAAAPAAPVVPGEDGRSNADPLVWSFSSADPGVTFACRLVVDGDDSGAFTACTSNYSHTPDAQVTYRLDVVAVDDVGNVSEPTLGPTFTYDSVGPVAPVVELPTASGSTTSATWTVTAAQDAVRHQCLLTRTVGTTTSDVGTWADCAAFTFALEAGDGTYVLHVRSYDDLGNVSDEVAGPGYTLDATAPTAPTVSGSLTGTGGGTSISYSWTTEAGATARCRLLLNGVERATYADCHQTTPFPVTLSFGDGSYTFEVIVTDSFGNIGDPGTSATYVLDTSNPVAPTITAAPPARTTSTTLSWTIEPAGEDGGATLECRLVRVGTTAGAFGTCLAGYADLEDGTYRLDVRSVDEAQNRSDITASGEVTVDTAPPVAPVVELPTASGSTTSATWTVTAAQDAVRHQCLLTRTVGTTTSDVGTWADCAAFTFALEAGDGIYVLHVRSYDDLGNVSDEVAGPGYTLDATAPGTPVVSSSLDGTTGSGRAVSYTYDGEGTATCYLYRGDDLVTPADAVCGPDGYTATLPAQSGTYRLEVTFTDDFGNTSQRGISEDYILDVTPPDAPTVVGDRDGDTDNERAVSYTYGDLGDATCYLYRNGALVTPDDAVCSDTGYTATLPDSSGSYVLEVTFTDAYGNVSDAGASGTYILDVTLPGPATVTVTPRTDNVESATWTVTPPESGTTTECRLMYGTTVVQDWDTCAAPYTYALEEGDGEYTLEVRVVDAVGNVGPVRIGESYTVDMTRPLTPTVDSNRTVKDNERSVTYTFSGEGVATCQLMRDGVAEGDPVVGCTSPYTITLPNTSGSYVLVVTYEDAVGNVSLPGSSAAYDLDVTPPDAPDVDSDRSGRDNERTVTYEFEGEGQAMCRLTRGGTPLGDWEECTSPWVVELPTTDGEYVLLVTYTDGVGNTSAAGESVPYFLDLTPPAAPVVLGPPATGNTRTVTWTYSGDGNATCTLLLAGAAYGPESACDATSFTTTLPSDGAWSLQVVFTDLPGNRGPPGTSATYLLDTVAPVAPGITGPTGPAQSRTPGWSVTAEADTTVECRLTRAGVVISDWRACSGSYGADLTNLPDGAYVVEARATDRAGNLGPVGTSAPYVLDTTAPLAPTVTGPTGPSQSRSPGFTWIGETGTTAECQLSRDGSAVGGWVACSSGFAPTLDRDGTWTVTVRLTDVAGNVGPAASSGGYVLDTTAPPPPIVTPPQSPGRDLAPSWGAVVEGGTTLECRLTAPDGTSSGWMACTLPHVTALEGRPDGAYVLEVRATDVAGNLSAVGSGRYVLDTVAPEAAVVTAPASPGRSRTPAFAFTGEDDSTARCRLTSGTTVISDFAPCTSPSRVDLTGLPDGTYTLTVRISDAAGNPGPAATGTYVLDTTGPDAPVLTLAPGSPSAARRTTWAFTYEPGSTLVCRVTSPSGAVRDIASCSSPLTLDLTGQPEGTWTLTVRAVDAAGNVGTVLTLTYVLDLDAISGPQVTGPVSPGSSRTPRWTISTATTTECRLTLGTTVLRDWGLCAGAFTADLFGKPDGTYVLAVRTRTGTGTLSAPTTSRYVLDTTPPAAATLVGPPTPSTNRRPTWSIASPELGAKAECRVMLFGSVLRDWAPCAVSPAGSLFGDLDLTGRGDGTYTLVVRLTDAAGNRGPEVSSSYVLDTSAPVGVGVTGPPSPGNDTTPTWTFSSAGTTQLECRLTSVDGVVSDWDTCSGSFTADLTGLPDGTYTLAVRALSAAGTPGPETTSAYVLSTEAPDGPGALALSGTNPTSNDRSPTWTFTLPSGTTGYCVVMQGATTVYDGPCASPFTLDLSRAQDGSYTLTVTAIDAAGTASQGVSSTYVLDTVPTAAPVLTQVPGAIGSTLDPQWRFTVVWGATAECRLLYDGVAIGDWAACTSPFTAILTGRPDGRYVLEVRAVDAAGNSSAPRSSTYVLDRTAAPIVTFTDTPPTPGTDRTVAWAFDAPADTSVECRLVGPDRTTSWEDCAGSSRLDLTGRPDGDYVLEVRVVEADGRRGSVSRATYTLDTRPPAAPAFSSVPDAAGNDPRPRWSWDATSDDRVECRLVRVGGTPMTGWTPCTSPYEAHLSAQGSYALELRVVDAAGNISAVTSSAYRYDTTAPTAAVLTSRPPSSGADRSVSWTFTMPADSVATCTVTRGLSRIDEGSCSGRYDLDLRGMPDGVYTLTIRLTDSAGNVSAATTGRYGLSTVGLRGPVRVDPPTAPTSPSTGGAPLPPRGPGRGGTGSVPNSAPQGSTSRPGVPNFPIDSDVPRSSADRPGIPRDAGEEVAAPQPKPRDSSRARNPLLADPLPVGDVPEVLREAVTSTITRPTLPLALLAIVILFLLAQNRIDRRDPKLASAPVEAEPELDFTTVIRRPGGALT